MTNWNDPRHAASKAHEGLYWLAVSAFMLAALWSLALQCSTDKQFNAVAERLECHWDDERQTKLICPESTPNP